MSVKRVQHSLTYLGRPWASKILLAAEFDRAPTWDNAEYVARLFCAKEACSKALGTGFTKGVGLANIEIELPGIVRLSKGALRRMNAIVGKDHQAIMFIDTFCKSGLAGATAILYSAPRQNRQG